MSSALAPRSAAVSKNSWPSKRSPRRAMNRSPAWVWRESVETRLTEIVPDPFSSFPAQASTMLVRLRASTFHFRAKVAVATAVMVFSRDVVSFIPSPLVSLPSIPNKCGLDKFGVMGLSLRFLPDDFHPPARPRRVWPIYPQCPAECSSSWPRARRFP